MARRLSIIAIAMIVFTTLALCAMAVPRSCVFSINDGINTLPFTTTGQTFNPTNIISAQFSHGDDVPAVTGTLSLAILENSTPISDSPASIAVSISEPTASISMTIPMGAFANVVAQCTFTPDSSTPGTTWTADSETFAIYPKCYVDGQPGQCAATNSVCDATDNECHCPMYSQLNEPDQTQCECSVPNTSFNAGQCVCDVEHQIIDENSSQCVCPSGSTLNIENNTCGCDIPEQDFNDQGVCSCPQYTTLTNGACVTDPITVEITYDSTIVPLAPSDSPGPTVVAMNLLSVEVTNSRYPGTATIGFYIESTLQGNAPTLTFDAAGATLSITDLAAPTINSQNVVIKVDFVATSPGTQTESFSTVVFKIIPTCHIDAQQDSSATQCPENSTCADDSTCTCSITNQEFDEQEQICKCKTGLTFNDANDLCECPVEHQTFENEQCTCPSGSTLNTVDNICECNIPKQSFNGQGQCQCPANSSVNPLSNQCECVPEHQTFDQNNTCVCPPNSQLNENGDSCECTISQQTFNNEGTCVCPEYYIVDPDSYIACIASPIVVEITYDSAVVPLAPSDSAGPTVVATNLLSVKVTNSAFPGAATIGFYIGSTLQGTERTVTFATAGSTETITDLAAPTINSQNVVIKVDFVATAPDTQTESVATVPFTIIPTCHIDAQENASATLCEIEYTICGDDSICVCDEGYVWEDEAEAVCIVAQTTPTITISAKIEPNDVVIPFTSEYENDPTKYPSPINMNQGAVLAVAIDSSSSKPGVIAAISIGYFPQLISTTFTQQPIVIYSHPTTITIDPAATTTTTTINLNIPQNVDTKTAFVKITFVPTDSQLSSTTFETVPFAIYPSCAQCVNGTCAANNQCVCNDGFEGSACNIAIEEVDICAECNQEHLSRCSESGNKPTSRSTPCTCDEKWGGMLCEDANACLAAALTSCGYNRWKGVYKTLSDGKCESQCTCFDHWGGSDCQTCQLECLNNGLRYKDCNRCGCAIGFSGDNCQCLSATVSVVLNGVNSLVTSNGGNFTSADNVFNPLLSSDVGLLNFHASIQQTVASLLSLPDTAISSLSIVPTEDKKSTKFTLNVQYNCATSAPDGDQKEGDEAAFNVTATAPDSFEALSAAWTTAADSLLTQTTITSSLTFTETAKATEVTAVRSDATLPPEGQEYDPNGAFSTTTMFVIVIGLVIAALL